jgi:hypothetical protein
MSSGLIKGICLQMMICPELKETSRYHDVFLSLTVGEKIEHISLPALYRYICRELPHSRVKVTFMCRRGVK